ncbi:MAG: AAA family ATPase, partial [Bifidobacteriaceae bacterium]|nr:AAA family ATPase [Bifidobacteriaceae bacterium]MDR2799284.1 AAA family ATPase [Bifidobacteriaceae bacterium]
MAIDKTRLYNFRNFSDTVFKFKENINFIYGENGSGKTN